jgi:CheY-like chemotaxis protein
VRQAAVRLRRVGGKLEVTVEDKGKGFDPTEALSGTTPRGFGLLGIRERIGLLGGHLDVHTTPGKGSQFILTLPDKPHGSPQAMKDRSAWPAIASTEIAAGAGVALPTSVIRVALADDHRSVREGLARLLEEEPDVEVVGEADDGRQAVDLVKELRPDIIVMDVSMPVMNGVDATRVIKREFPGVRVVALSMFDQEDMVQSMLEAGAEAYLCKSGPSEELIRTIRKRTQK